MTSPNSSQRVYKKILQLIWLLAGVGVATVIAFWAVEQVPSLPPPAYKPTKFSKLLWDKDDILYRFSAEETYRSRMSGDILNRLTPFGKSRASVTRLLGKPELPREPLELQEDKTLGYYGEKGRVVKAFGYCLSEGPDDPDDPYESSSEYYITFGFDKNGKLCWKGKELLM